MDTPNRAASELYVAYHSDPKFSRLATEFGKIIAEQTQRIQMEQTEAWERVLRLHIRPKPAWMPERLWAHLLNLVLHQTVTKK